MHSSELGLYHIPKQRTVVLIVAATFEDILASRCGRGGEVRVLLCDNSLFLLE